MAASITDENYLVANQGKHPLVNFNFMLRVEALFDLPCKSVRAFSRELEYDFIQEGGLNDYVHMRRKPITKPFTLEVERYVGIDYFDPMPLGADLVLPVVLLVSRYESQFIPFLVARTYVFTGCTVMKKTYGDLIGDKSGLLIETTTLGYRELLCVDIPWSMLGQRLFDNKVFDATSAISAAESLERIKQLSQAAYEKIKGAKAIAQTAYDDIVAKIGLLPAAITDAKTNTSTTKEALTSAEAALSPAASALKSAEDDLKEKRKPLNEKKAALDSAQKAVNKALQDNTAAETELKTAENAAKSAKWKADRADKLYTDAKSTSDDAEKAISDAKNALSEAKKELESKKNTPPSGEEDSSAGNAAISVLEGKIASLKTTVKDLEKEAKAANENTEKFKSSAETAKEALDDANAKLTEAKTAAAETAKELASAKTALAAPEAGYAKAKDAADKAEADVAAKRKLVVAAETDIRNKQQAHSKAVEVENALMLAQKTSETRKEASKTLLDSIPGKITTCENKNKEVQAATELAEANNHYPTVQSSSGDVQKALDTILSTQKYFINCLAK